MTRRPLMPRHGTIDRRASRMAPGGRVRSESRIEMFYPYIGDSGEEQDITDTLVTEAEDDTQDR